MSSPILEMREISKRFPGVIALDSVNLEIYPGEIVALAGENGAGKSTLMKILGGIYQPDGGTLFIDGQETTISSVSDSINKGIGFIHQELNVLDNLNIAENVFLGREPTWGGPLKLVNRQRLHAETVIYLERLGLNVSSQTSVAELPIAQQQMVEIAKALSLKARILIMDEPTSSLTLTETDCLLQVCKDLREQGVSIVYISHRLGEIKEIADRVVTLRDGKNAGILAKEEISHERIVKMMVGRDISQLYEAPKIRPEAVFVEINDLVTRRYPNKTVSLGVRKGEILGVAGLVGAGRSEMAQAIFGVDAPLGGTVNLGGKIVKISSAQDAINNGIYLIPEDRRHSGLILDVPIRENISLPALMRYSSAGLVNYEAERKVATEMCEKLKVKTPSIDAFAGNLSGGNQQKVVLAKWLSLNPKLLIFDEPTRGIDVGAKSEIYTLMRQLAESGVAIIMISSDMEEVLNQSDRIAVMHEGAITGILEREDCTEETVMKLAVGQTINHG
jgi:ribose transport system ATP-binding protein